MLEGQGLLINFGITQSYVLLRVVVDHLLYGVTAESLVVGLLQYPTDATRQIFGIAVVCYIAVTLVVYLLWNAAHLESHAGYTTGHGFHDGVGQVLRERWQHEYVNGIVDIDDTPLVVYVA